MKNIDVTLSLPEDLVERAKSEGLLNDQRVADWLEKELDRQRKIKALREDLQVLRSIEPVIAADPTDDAVLACAKAGSADFIVSGDGQHLLKLGIYEAIPILDINTFLDQLSIR